MHDTFSVDDVFRRAVPVVEPLAEIEFADMEPVDALDLVGVPPLQALASIPFAPYDLVGVPPAVAVALPDHAPTTPKLQPFSPRRRALSAEELPTEEFPIDDEPQGLFV